MDGGGGESRPVRRLHGPLFFVRVAQLEERRLDMAEVAGSIPAEDTVTNYRGG